jgi:bifunctional non-homologous end joining protein LigD
MPATDASAEMVASIDGRTVKLTNLDKVLYPGNGFTKAEVLDYYARIADVLLPHLAGRPLTRKRWVHGTAGPSFFEKNTPKGAPSWVRRVTLPVPGSTKNRDEIDFVIAEETPTLAWLANLAALELHVPQWQVDADGTAQPPDLLVLDLDPGQPATVVECCEVAIAARAIVEEEVGPLFAKVSGSKGMQLYARWPGRAAEPDDSAEYAHSLAQRLETDFPELVVSRMTKTLRPGKVLVDWSQNNPAKTTIAPYSLRGRELPTVSAPVTWDEVASCTDPADLVFLPADVLSRVGQDGDLFAGLLDADR